MQNFSDLSANETATSLTIAWIHEYILCKNFTVCVSGTPCKDLKRGANRTRFDNLDANTTYTVKVTATEVNMTNVTISDSFTTTIAPGVCYTL